MELTSKLPEGFEWSPPIDYLGLQSVLAPGDLRSVVRYYDAGYDSIGLSAQMATGDMRSLVKTYTIPTEHFSLTAVASSGQLRQVVITYSNWIPEPFKLTSTLSGGSLV